MKQVLLYLLLSILVHISSAYISDIKLVSCDASHACANYPGYLKLDTDLNKGVKDAPSVFMHIKEDPSQEPITDLMIMRGNDNATGIPHFNKWKKLKLDLNEGTDHPLYLLYTKDTSISNNPVTSIIVKEGSSPVVGAEYKRIEVDLNQDVGGYHLFMYYSQDGIKDPITSITAKECFTDNCYIDGWERVEKDLNKGVVFGMSVYLFYKREKLQDPVSDVVILINDQTPPEGYKKIDVNLNAATIRGDSIYLWYKTDSKTKVDEAVQELAIEYGKDAVTPFGWNKINVDLNSEKEGKGNFGEATHLFFKRGYKALPEIPRLVFDENSQFKILQLGDLHLTNEKGECRDVPVDMDCDGDTATLKVIERLLEREKPNLVIFSGDNINGGGVSDSRAASFKFAEPVIKKKIPWAAIFGNHDDENDLTREELFEVIRRMPYSLTERGPLDIPGVGNYILKVYSNATKAATHDFTLYFLDSHGYTDDTKSEYDYIKQEQLDWLVNSANGFSQLSSKPNAAAFFHMPIWEYHHDGRNTLPILGDSRESVSSPPKNDISALEAFKKAGDIKLTSCGHDHVNDYCIEKKDIQLCYGGGASYSGYGASHLGWERRARIINILYNGDTVVSWKRLYDENLTMRHFQTLYSDL